jgi:DNA-binding NarL/FixJ family response regulator
MQEWDRRGSSVADAEDAEPVRVVIADDHPLLLAGIRRSLESRDDIEIIGEARSGPQVLAIVARRQPHVVLLDLRMPGMSGVECIAKITSDWPEVKTVVLSATDDPCQVDAALAAGASAYIVKSVNAVDIGSVITQASVGGVFHARPYKAREVEPSEESGRPALTDRERSILDAVAAGMTTAAISQDLWVSEHTVKFHLTNIYRKLGVANRAGAVRYAIENGMVAAA